MLWLRRPLKASPFPFCFLMYQTLPSKIIDNFLKRAFPGRLKGDHPGAGTGYILLYQNDTEVGYGKVS
jgi:hypothetical protein